MTRSPALAASAVDSTRRPSERAFSTEAESGRSPTTTFTPESRRLSAWACPWEPGARKVVTVVFCDVADSTGLGERLDPEVLRAIMSRYFREMRAVLERHGGTIEKFIGDAVMAVFGVPTLHEDDALRAVTAAA